MNNNRKILSFSIITFFLLTSINSVYAYNQTIDNKRDNSNKLLNNSINKYEELATKFTKDYYRDDISYRHKDYLKNRNIPNSPVLIDSQEWDIIVPDDYPTIQEAIDNANPRNGFHILVRSGTYLENIVINTDGIVIHGESKGNTIIDGRSKGDVIRICARNVSLSGFTIQQSGMNDFDMYYAGVKLLASDSCIIYNCNIQNNKGYGIVIENAVNCTFFQNFINMNQYDGMYLVNTHHILIAETLLENNNENEISCYNSSSISIVNNSIISTNLNAVLFSLSHNSILIGNNITGLGFSCIQLRCSSFNKIEQNTIYSESDSALSFLYKSNNNSIFNNSIIGISFVVDSIGILNQDSDFNGIYENIISAFNKGIECWVSSQIELKYNKIFLNNFGVSLNSCNSICIIGNNLSYNTINALSTEQSNLILISNNTISFNGFEGIYMGLYSDYSEIINNYIVYNKGNGINLYSCQYNTLSNNFISYNEQNGMLIYESKFSYISNNTFMSNREYGLYLRKFDFRDGNHKVVDNSFYNCGVFNERTFNNIFQNNTINDKYLLYLERVKDRVISNESYGSIILVRCDNITVMNQHMYNTSVGVQLLFSSNCRITQNVFKYNSYGVYILYSNSSTITKNNFIKNEIDSIYTLWIYDPIRTNIWDSNYWDSAYSVVIPIHGYKYIYFLDIWYIKFYNVCFDFHPSSNPYSYENTEV